MTSRPIPVGGETTPVAYEYFVTEGPRKGWDGDPDLTSDGWERDPTIGSHCDGWERHAYHETITWRRPLPAASLPVEPAGTPEQYASALDTLAFHIGRGDESFREGLHPDFLKEAAACLAALTSEVSALREAVDKSDAARQLLREIAAEVPHDYKAHMRQTYCPACAVFDFLGLPNAEGDA